MEPFHTLLSLLLRLGGRIPQVYVTMRLDWHAPAAGLTQPRLVVEAVNEGERDVVLYDFSLLLPGSQRFFRRRRFEGHLSMWPWAPFPCRLASFDPCVLSISASHLATSLHEAGYSGVVRVVAEFVLTQRGVLSSRRRRVRGRPLPLDLDTLISAAVTGRINVRGEMA